MAKYATNASGAMLLINLIQVTGSISGSAVPLAMFYEDFPKKGQKRTVPEKAQDMHCKQAGSARLVME